MSVLLKYVCFYFCQLLIIVSLPGRVNGQNYQIIKGYKFWESSRLWEDEAPRSLIQCAVVCKQTERCCCVMLTSSTGKCSYYDWFKDDSVHLRVDEGDADDTVILVKPVPGKILSRRYTRVVDP